jgi:transposase
LRQGPAKLFFLPNYSPDLNPIEQVFAKLRTVKAVWAAIGQLRPTFMPKECANYFENAG